MYSSPLIKKFLEFSYISYMRSSVFSNEFTQKHYGWNFDPACRSLQLFCRLPSVTGFLNVLLSLVFSYCSCDRDHGGFDCSVEIVSHQGKCYFEVNFKENFHLVSDIH